MNKYRIITLTLNLGLIAVYAKRLGELNDECDLRQDCNIIGYTCWSNHTCQCQRPVYIPNRSRTKCIGIVDQKCKYDEHCIEGAFCYRQERCLCKEDYYPNEDNTMCINGSGNKLAVSSLSLILVLVLLGLG